MAISNSLHIVANLDGGHFDPCLDQINQMDQLEGVEVLLSSLGCLTSRAIPVVYLLFLWRAKMSNDRRDEDEIVTVTAKTTKSLPSSRNRLESTCAYSRPNSKLMFRCSTSSACAFPPYAFCTVSIGRYTMFFPSCTWYSSS